jgi:hypothetical protein
MNGDNATNTRLTGGDDDKNNDNTQKEPLIHGRNILLSLLFLFLSNLLFSLVEGQPLRRLCKPVDVSFTASTRFFDSKRKHAAAIRFNLRIIYYNNNQHHCYSPWQQYIQ